GERFLEMAKRQVRHLVRLVDDLLDVARITRGKIALRKEPVLLADLAARAVELARPLVDARGHALTVSLPSEPVRLEADAVRLLPVPPNLLGNAAKDQPPRRPIWLPAEPRGGRAGGDTDRGRGRPSQDPPRGGPSGHGREPRRDARGLGARGAGGLRRARRPPGGGGGRARCRSLRPRAPEPGRLRVRPAAASA